MNPHGEICGDFFLFQIDFPVKRIPCQKKGFFQRLIENIRIDKGVSKMILSNCLFLHIARNLPYEMGIIMILQRHIKSR
jgi:hypothetical protein